MGTDLTHVEETVCDAHDGGRVAVIEYSDGCRSVMLTFNAAEYALSESVIARIRGASENVHDLSSNQKKEEDSGY